MVNLTEVNLSWRESLSVLWLSARNSPEVVLMWLVSAAGAVWAVHSGLFPGTGHFERSPWLGSMIVAIMWLCLYVCLALVYLEVLEKRSPRSLLRILAVCLILIVASSPFSRLLNDSFLLYVLHANDLFLVFSFVLWLGLLLGKETGALWRARRNSKLRTPFTLAILIAVAALAVYGMEAMVHLLVTGRMNRIALGAFPINVLLLGSIFVLLCVFTSRISVAILLGCTVYFGFGLATIAKMIYMHAAIQPLDLLYIPEFIPQFRSTFGIAPALAFMIVSVPVVVSVILVWKIRAERMPAVPRVIGGGLSALFLIFVVTSQLNGVGRGALKRAGLRIA